MLRCSVGSATVLNGERNLRAVKSKGLFWCSNTAERTEWLALPPMAPESYDWKCNQDGEGLMPLLLLEM